MVGKQYVVTKQIKLHTNPLRTAQIQMVGTFVKETDNYYVFEAFRVRKANVIKIAEQ